LPLAACLLSLALGGCGSLPPPPNSLTEGPKTETIYLVERGWHTDVGVRADDLDASAGRNSSQGPSVGRFREIFPGVRTVLFGFGERAYLLHPNHNFADMLAALMPSPGAMLVTALRTAPDDAFPRQDVVALHISPAGLAALDDFLTRSFETTPQGDFRPIANGPYPGSMFYAATGTYSAGFTCNTWSAEALETAGLPVRPAGVVFADGVADQARRIAATYR
jgi:uncharacterized protein (TIGR02117 family)